MNTYLVKHALENIWCFPGIDTYLTLELARLTKDQGATGRLYSTYYQYHLPTTDDSYHVYMLGNIPLDLLGIDREIVKDDWVKLDDSIASASTVVNLFSGNGYDIGLWNVFIHINRVNEIILAVNRNGRNTVIDNSILLMRIYKNDYFESDRKPNQHETILYRSYTGGSDNQLREFIRYHDNLNNLYYGSALLSFNGLWHSKISIDDVNNNSLMTSYFDGSIKSKYIFPIEDLTTFISKLDNRNKYIIHPPKQIITINYYSNVDFYLGTSNGVDFKGIRINTHNKSTVRHLTHNDYSLDVEVIQQLRTTHFKTIPLNDLSIIAVIRHGRFLRDVYYFTDKIKGLYKLNDERIADAMAGIDSNVYFWKAAHLEAALYPEIMSSSSIDVTSDKVSSCYGYYGTAKALANTPIIVKPSGSRIIQLPPVYIEESLIAEYSGTGELLGHYQIQQRPSYITENSETQWIECLSGKSSTSVYKGWDRDIVELIPTVKYRAYTATKYSDGSYGEWVDRTGDGSYYIKEHELIWNISGDDHIRTIIGEDLIYRFDDNIDYGIGIIWIKLLVDTIDSEGHEISIPMSLPMESYRVWVNDKALVFNLDYYIRGDSLFIINKEYLKPETSELKLRVIAYGTVKGEIQIKDPYETGYVKWNKLYFNDRYDYREDWMDRYIVGGNVYPKEVLSFAEDGSTDITINDVNLVNGTPYMVETVFPALPSDIEIDYEAEVELAKKRGNIINEYLGEFLPVIPPDRPSIIPSKYKLFSPFLSLATVDLINDRWILPDGDISDEKLDSLVEGYKWLLSYEPINNGADTDYISVHPHPYYEVLYVTQKEYSILERMSNIYLNGSVDLTPHLGIK